MLQKIISFSIRNKLIIGLFTIALIIFGVYETTKLPIDAVPDITNNQVQIITVAPALGAADIERLVTFPIEQEVSNISGIHEIRSFSRFGLSLVTIVFDENVDVYWARQQVSERIQSVQNSIPEGVGIPELGPISTGLGEIYQYVVRPEKGYEDRYDVTELRTIQDWIVRRQLLGVKGIAEVSSFGGKLKQYEVAVNSNSLQAYGLNINDLFLALEKNNRNTGGAYIEKGPGVLFIRSEGLIDGIADIENIAVKSTSADVPVLVKDVANVKIGHATRYGAMTYNDKGEVAGAVVMMLKGANSNQVIKDVKQRIEQIQKTLPKGVVIESFLDRTKMVNNAIRTIETNLMEGALIVVFILVLFLGNFRAGLLVVSVIPLSMLFAIIMMNLFGVSGNLMSLGALDFGLIVDGAVIIVEAVLHRFNSDKKYIKTDLISQKEMDSQVGSSASRMVNSAVFGQIIILIVYLPILTLQGIEGKMFKPMAQTVSFALIGAFILSLTYIPMMSTIVLSKKLKHKDTFSDQMMKKLEKIHQKLLVRVIHHPKIVILSVLLLFLFSLFVLSRLGGEFIPALEEGDFAVDTRVLTGSNLNTTIEYTQKAAHILVSDYPEVEKVVTKIGSGEVPTDPMPMEASDMMVILKPKKEWTSAKTFPELAEKMGKSLEVIPGISTGFQYPVQMRFNELMTGARQDVVCKIFGEDMDSLVVYANKLGDFIRTVEGAEDLYIEPITGMPQIVVKYRRSNLAQYKLDIDEVNRIVNNAFAGQTAGSVYEGEKRFELVVRLDEKQRENLEDIRNLLIPTPEGIQIPLYQLADVDIITGPAQIQREDSKRRITVGFNVRGRDVQSIVDELSKKLDSQLSLPAGYYLTYGGAFENLNQAKSRLMVAVPVSLALIFILLFFAFRSIRESLLIYTAIPLSAIGGIFFLALRGMPFSISAGVGFIALFGVSVLNGIVLISEFNRMKKSAGGNLEKIALEGARTRLRPVLMTAFVASLGFLPMALSKGAGAEVQRPLATVVIGGLLIATFLTLFILPTLFIQFEKIKIKKMKFNRRKLSLFLLVAGCLPVFGQTVDINEAIEMAEKNNLSIKDGELYAEYQSKRKETYLNLPKTGLTAELGQLNGNSFDNKIGIEQSFEFPTVYKRQRQLIEQEFNTSVKQSNLNKTDVKKLTRLVFYQIIVLRKKQEILKQTDLIYSDFLEKSELRLSTGASNLLERNTAQIQRQSISNRLKLIENEIEILKIQLQLLMNSDLRYEPVSDEITIPFDGIADEILTAVHPAMDLANSRIEQSKSQLALEKSKMLPNFSVAYFNQSFNNLNSSRYNVVSIGIGLPIFNGAQRAQIKAEEFKISYYENQQELKKRELEAEYRKAAKAYETEIQIVEDYENGLLPAANEIMNSAKEQFVNGAIDYLDWTLLHNQAVQVSDEYFDNVMQLNHTIIEILYLTSK